MIIEVAYSGIGGAQAIIKVELPQGSTVKEGIRASKILELGCFPEFREFLELSELSEFLNGSSENVGLVGLEGRLGIFGKLASLDSVLKNGDRIEIYRPLLKSPRVARLDRAKKSQLKK